MIDQIRSGALLRELRKEKNMTQEQVAECFNVATRTVSRWETGKNMPDLALLIEIAEFYDVDVREILEGKRESENENMTDETRETLKLVADYTEFEQEKLMKELSVCTVATVIGFLSLWIVPVLIDIMPGLNLEDKHSSFGSFVYFVSIFGLIFSIKSFTRLLQIRGNLNKNRLKKIRRVLLPITIGVLLVCTIGVILLTLFITH